MEASNSGKYDDLSKVGFPINNDLVGFDEKLGINFIYDISTTNLSFIQTAKDLSHLGVTNNKFFLKLYDPKLIGVNPYDPVVSQENIKRITIECVRNPWYFLREISRIPEQGSAQGPGSGSKFQLHRGNLAAIYCFLHNINFYLVLPRQTGKTQSMISILLWTYIFGTTNSEMAFLNKSQGDANLNLSRLRSQKELLPGYMQQNLQFIDGEFKSSKGKDNVQTMQNPINGNRIVTKPSARTREAAENIGRGNTSPIQFFDEVEFSSYISRIISSSGPAFVQAARNALKNGAPYCRIFITTPGDMDSEPVESTNDMRSYCAEWSDNLYNLSEAELLAYLQRCSETSMFYIEYSYRQIGKDESWFQEQCKQLYFVKTDIKREILLQRIRGSSDSPFDVEDLDAINGLQKEVLEEILLYRIYNIRLYEKINKNIPYIIGVDVSTGTNGDNTAISIIDPYKERAVGEFKSPIMDPNDICTFLRLLIKKVTPKGILCIERNSLGDAVIAILKRTEVSYNLYYDSDAVLFGTPDEKLDEKGFIKREAENRRYYGVHTNIKSREMMMTILMRLVAEKKDSFVTKYIIADLNNLVKKKSGKIEARSGTHDDNIMSFLIGMYVLYHGKKLYIWGFKRGSTPIDSETMKPMEYSDIYDMMPEEMKKQFDAPTPKEDPFQSALKQAIIENQRSRENFSLSDSAIVTKDDNIETDYTKYEDDNLTEDQMDFFLEINK